jgi:hypothetical protein
MLLLRVTNRVHVASIPFDHRKHYRQWLILAVGAKIEI